MQTRWPGGKDMRVPRGLLSSLSLVCVSAGVRVPICVHECRCACVEVRAALSPCSPLG